MSAPEQAEAGTPAGEPAADRVQEGGPAAERPRLVTPSDLADALLVIAEAFLAGKVATASDPEIYQVIVHVGTDVLPHSTPAPSTPATADPAPGDLAVSDPAGGTGGQPAPTPTETLGGVSAETPAASRAPGHPADPARCHLQDGPAISITTAQMITCTAALSWLLHDRDGTTLDAGRRRRRPTSAQRRAARDRDHGRCRYPGCESRRTDLHHIQYWSNGGPTTLDNLISLCKCHHMLLHDRGYLIAARPGGAFTFYLPDGTPLPASPALPEPGGTIGDCHDAEITPDTIIPAWYGEHLDLDYAIHACFANADYQARHQHDQHTTATTPAPEPGPWTPAPRKSTSSTPSASNSSSTPSPDISSDGHAREQPSRWRPPALSQWHTRGSGSIRESRT